MTPRRQWLLFALRLGFGLAVLAAVVLYGGLEAVPRALRAAEPGYFWSAFLVSIAGSIVVPAIVTRRNFGVAGIRFSLRELVRINLAMRFYVLMLPHAVTVGMRWHRYREAAKGKGWQLAALIAFERTTSLSVVLLTAAVLLAALGERVPAELRLLVPLSAAASAVALAVLSLFVSSRVFALARPLLDRLAAATPPAVSGRIGRLTRAMVDCQRLGGLHLAAVVAWSLAGHFLFVLSGYLVSRGLGLGFGLADLGWMRSVIYLVTLLPATVGGLGVREIGFAALFVMQGVDRATAVAFPLVLLAIQLLIGLCGSVLEIARLLLRRGESGDATVQG